MLQHLSTLRGRLLRSAGVVLEIEWTLGGSCLPVMSKERAQRRRAAAWATYNAAWDAWQAGQAGQAGPQDAVEQQHTSPEPKGE